jgi:uncharacterized phage-associated protein
MAIHAFNAANLLLSKGDRDNIPIDPMKLQKLLYLAHGWHLAHLDASLIYQDFQAWAYGPVIPDIYREFKAYGAAPINGHAPAVNDSQTLSPASESLCESVWQTYKGFTGVQLSALTHEPGYAWDAARRELSGWTWGSPSIPNETIRSEFLQRLARSEQ